MKRFVFALAGALYTFRKTWQFYPELQRIRARHRKPTVPESHAQQLAEHGGDPEDVC